MARLGLQPGKQLAVIAHPTDQMPYAAFYIDLGPPTQLVGGSAEIADKHRLIAGPWSRHRGLETHRKLFLEEAQQIPEA